MATNLIFFKFRSRRPSTTQTPKTTTPEPEISENENEGSENDVSESEVSDNEDNEETENEGSENEDSDDRRSENETSENEESDNESYSERGAAGEITEEVLAKHKEVTHNGKKKWTPINDVTLFDKAQKSWSKHFIKCFLKCQSGIKLCDPRPFILRYVYLLFFSK
jgi:hypothetical protein